MTTDSNKAKTFDDGKAPLSMVPWAGVRSMALVQAYGHKKYGDYNNYRKGMEISRNLSCAIRHISAFMDGEDLDPESKESHLGHAMCRLAFVLQNLADGVAIDDRYKKLAAVKPAAVKPAAPFTRDPPQCPKCMSPWPIVRIRGKGGVGCAHPWHGSK